MKTLVERNDGKVVSINKASEKRKPLNWQNRFDLVVSKKKCPPIESRKGDTFKGLIYKERKIVQTNDIVDHPDYQVRLITGFKANVDDLIISFRKNGWIHTETPLSVFIGPKDGKMYLFDGHHRYQAITNKELRDDWKHIIVDIYEIAAGANEEIVFGTLGFIINQKNSSLPSTRTRGKDVVNWMRVQIQKGNYDDVNGWNEIVEKVRAIAADMLPKQQDKIIRDLKANRVNPEAKFQEYHLGEGRNSVEHLSKGWNPQFPEIRLPFKGDQHYSVRASEAKILGGFYQYQTDESNGILTPNIFGYVVSSSHSFKDNFCNGMMMSVKYDGAQILYYTYVKSPYTSKNWLRSERIKLKENFTKYNEYYRKFIAGAVGQPVNEIETPFKLIGFLPQQISIETTIVNVKGEPVDYLTGELLEC